MTPPLQIVHEYGKLPTLSPGLFFLDRHHLGWFLTMNTALVPYSENSSVPFSSEQTMLWLWLGIKDVFKSRLWPLDGLRDCATKHRITKSRFTKCRKNKTSNYKTPITKRRKLQKVELQNVELQNAESYKRSKNKRSKIPKPNKRSKITKSRKRRENTIQCGKKPRKNFSKENQKGGEKFPWAFFFF